jgi:pyruvate dehydrogenase (quinone)
MPRVLEIAIQTVLSKQGVSVVVIPGDVATREITYRKPSVSVKRVSPLLRSSDDEVADLALLLNQSKTVTIRAGAGCAGAHAELMQAAEKLKSPIVTTLRGREHVEYDNPYDVELTGLIGFSSGYHAIKGCETLLMLGTDFPYTQFYPENATVIQVDRRGENLGRRTRLDLGLIGDVKETLNAVLEKIVPKTDDGHLRKFVSHYRDVRKGLDELAVGRPGKKPIHPQYVAKLIDQIASEDAIFTCDVGTPTIWAARYLTMNGKRRLLGSFNHGSMACAVPMAIGAQLEYPKRQVVTLSGDGGLAMLMGDLLSMRQLKLPVKMVVFNNSALSFVELEMKAAGFLENGTTLVNPNFADLANSAGIHGIRVEDPAELESAMSEAFRHDGPALIDVVVNRMELSMPPTITRDQAIGFSVWALKAVLNGRGSELVDLATSNLLR